MPVPWKSGLGWIDGERLAPLTYEDIETLAAVRKALEATLDAESIEDLVSSLHPFFQSGDGYFSGTRWGLPNFLKIKVSCDPTQMPCLWRVPCKRILDNDWRIMAQGDTIMMLCTLQRAEPNVFSRASSRA